jgi:hypothetical protein
MYPSFTESGVSLGISGIVNSRRSFGPFCDLLSQPSWLRIEGNQEAQFLFG